MIRALRSTFPSKLPALGRRQGDPLAAALAMEHPYVVRHEIEIEPPGDFTRSAFFRAIGNQGGDVKGRPAAGIPSPENPLSIGTAATQKNGDLRPPVGGK